MDEGTQAQKNLTLCNMTRGLCNIRRTSTNRGSSTELGGEYVYVTIPGDVVYGRDPYRFGNLRL